MKRKVLIAAVLIIGMGIGTGLYYYHKPVESLKNKEADVTITAEKLFSDFEANEENANAAYLNKIINVGGSIENVQKNSDGSVSLILSSGDPMGSVSCKLEAGDTVAALAMKKGATVHVNGKCTGYLMDVVLVNCSITEK